VYSFLDEKNKILYVGKAKNLKNRLTNYTQYSQLAPRIKKLVTTAQKLTFEVLDSELEALLIEAELIRVHQPFFNIRLKDDKSPIYLVITNELYPQLIKKRKNDLLKNKIQGTVFGPFQSSYKLNEVLKIARKIFPWCSSPPNNKSTNQACFYYHLDQCPGACIGAISVKDYQENIDNLKMFLKGKKKAVVQQLKEKMTSLATELKYEQAQQIKLKLQYIQEVTQKTYQLKPDLVLPGFGATKTELGLVELQKILTTYSKLAKNQKINRIECYDVSNVQGKNAAVSMVVAQHGKPTNSLYKLFNIHSIDTPNDYRMMQEALGRRQNHPDWGQPDLVIVDGGKGQVRAALKVWQWPCPVIGIAKDPDRLVIPLPATASEKYELIKLDSDHPALNLVQQLRDEAHRFAKKQWSRKHTRAMLNN